MKTKEELMAEFTAREIEDDQAFQKIVADSMIWLSTTNDDSKTMVIGNARRAWHAALKWERERARRGQAPTAQEVAEHIVTMVEGLSASSIGRSILAAAHKAG